MRASIQFIHPIHKFNPNLSNLLAEEEDAALDKFLSSQSCRPMALVLNKHVPSEEVILKSSTSQ